jgi:hypothetical protein
MRRNLLLWIAAFCCLRWFTTSVAAQNAVASHRVDYPDDGVQIGNGWKSGGNLKLLSTCVVFKTAQDGAQNKSVFIRSVTDKSSVMNQLQVSAELQVKAILGSASAKTEFIKKVEVKDEYSNFAVQALVTNGAKYAIPGDNGQVELTQSALKLAGTDPIAFFNQCGDTFVSALYGGAELDAILTFKTHSLDDQSTLKNSIEGSYSGVQLKASVTSTMQAYAQQSELAISFHQSGGSGDPIPTDQDGLTKAIQNLPSAAAAAPSFYQMEIIRYDSLANWPKASGAWASPDYGRIASQYERFSSLRDQVESILQNPNSFILGRGVTVKQLQDLDDSLLNHLRSLTKVAQACSESNGANCAISPDDRISDYAYRILLPVAQGSFAADRELTAAALDLGSKQKALADARAAVSKGFQDLLKVALTPEFIERLTAPQQAAATQAANYLATLQAAYPEALRDAVVKTWISPAVADRCRDNVNDDGCINNAQIADWSSKIVTQ